MTRVDDRRGLGGEIDARDLAGHELARLGELPNPALARRACSASSTPAGLALRTRRRARGEHRGVRRVAHRVGDREMQLVALEREIERVAADFAGGFQPGRERELSGLAR